MWRFSKDSSSSLHSPWVFKVTVMTPALIWIPFVLSGTDCASDAQSFNPAFALGSGSVPGYCAPKPPKPPSLPHQRVNEPALPEGRRKTAASEGHVRVQEVRVLEERLGVERLRSRPGLHSAFASVRRWARNLPETDCHSPNNWAVKTHCQF